MADPTTSIFSNNKTIMLEVSPESTRLEAKAAAGPDIIPGYLLQYNLNGEFEPHAPGDTPSEPIFAIENIYKGLTIDDHYQPGEIVYAIHCRPGDIVLAWLQEGRVSTLGLFYRSAGGGDLRDDSTVNTGAYVAVSLERIDTTAPAVPGRFKVQTL